MEVAFIKEVKHLSTCTKVRLEDGTWLCLRPYLNIAPGDKLEFIPTVEKFEEINKLILEKATKSATRVKIHPAYCKHEIVYVPPHSFEITFRERLSERDWRSAKLLEQFHYRGKGLNKIVGRRTLLLAVSKLHGVIGYGVVAATVAVAKPRFTLFETNFQKQMDSKLINRIVRIPRIVVHPEFRGIGLGVLIAKHLVEYVREYWDIQGYTPIAVEVIASMTDYHRFFEKAGFVNVGYTQGYENGIIPEYGKGSWEPRPNHKFYDFFKKQKPKPYLIYPLSGEVRIKMAERKLPTSLSKKPLPRLVQPMKPIIFNKVSIAYKASNGLTDRAAEIKEAFGVDATQMFSPVIKEFAFVIEPGDVVLFTGASGSGKSTIIKLLAQNPDDIAPSMEIEGELKGLEHTQVAILNTNWDTSLPLIDQVGKSTKEAISFLNGVGLAEAHLYLKRPHQISDGQRYRFAVARLCDSRKPLWVADDFACGLDPLTAAIVAKGLRKISWRFGATLVIAAPHIEHFLDSLLPNRLVRLRWGGMAVVYGLRLNCDTTNGLVKVRVANICRNVLSDVRLGGIIDRGQIETLWTIPALAPDVCETVEIDTSDVERFEAILVTSNEKVGDIIYFGDNSIRE